MRVIATVRGVEAEATTAVEVEAEAEAEAAAEAAIIIAEGTTEATETRTEK